MPIGLIKNHPVFSEYEPLDFLLRISKNSPRLSAVSIEYLLTQHPVTVVSASKGDYFCVGGLRSLSLARIGLDDDSEIQVIYLSGLSKAQIVEQCHLYLVLPAICFSTVSQKYLHRLIEKLPPNLISKISNQPVGSSSIARLLGTSRETIRRWMK